MNLAALLGPAAQQPSSDSSPQVPLTARSPCKLQLACLFSTSLRAESQSEAFSCKGLASHPEIPLCILAGVFIPTEVVAVWAPGKGVFEDRAGQLSLRQGLLSARLLEVLASSHFAKSAL